MELTPEQRGILNSLVTFAAENVPGGLNAEEQEVAKIVAGWVIPEMTHEEMVQETLDRR